MSDRSQASVCAEKSVRRADSALFLARCSFAAAFDAAMHAHWLRGEESLSNVAIGRACGVDEKTVRLWRLGEKPMPAAALQLLPSQVYGEMIDHLAGSRGRTPKRALVKLREALGELGGQLAHEDGSEVVRALVGAQGQLADLMKKAMGDR